MNVPMCPCGIKKEYSQCCEPFIMGEAQPDTAEQCMRSRYVAYTQANMDYIQSTHAEKTQAELDLNVAKNWAEQSEWIGLEIVSTEKGGKEDEHGLVEFKAHYRNHGKREVHHEVSEFVRQDGHWVYLDGRLPTLEQIKRDSPKVGRNDPCPCGSGKKYKKCCGIAA